MLVVKNSLVSEFEEFFGKGIDTSKNHLEDYWVNGHHQRHWVSNETGEKVAEATYMPSHEEFLERKKLREKLVITLKPLINAKLTNKKANIDANFSSKSISKLGSDKAINKSVINGFTTAEHFEAAAQIKRLYENADFIGRFLDDKENPNVLAMYRFQIPINLSTGRNAYAYISTKEVKIYGNRVYTLELLLDKHPEK